MNLSFERPSRGPAMDQPIPTRVHHVVNSVETPVAVQPRVPSKTNSAPQPDTGSCRLRESVRSGDRPDASASLNRLAQACRRRYTFRSSHMFQRESDLTVTWQVRRKERHGVFPLLFRFDVLPAVPFERVFLNGKETRRTNFSTANGGTPNLDIRS